MIRLSSCAVRKTSISTGFFGKRSAFGFVDQFTEIRSAIGASVQRLPLASKPTWPRDHPVRYRDSTSIIIISAKEDGARPMLPHIAILSRLNRLSTKKGATRENYRPLRSPHYRPFSSGNVEKYWVYRSMSRTFGTWLAFGATRRC